MLKSNILKLLVKTVTILSATGVAIIYSSKLAIASEEIIFRYGGVTEKLDLEEVQTFAKTGKTSASIDFLLGFGQQNPQSVQKMINQKFPADTTLIYDLLKTAPGEYILSQTGNVVSSRSKRANVKALRGAIVKSASDDEMISLVELLENYPTKQVYVDAKALVKVHRSLTSLIEKANEYLKIPLEILSN